MANKTSDNTTLPQMPTRSTVRNQVEIIETSFSTKYIGKRDDLIEGGFAYPDMFPEGRKRKNWHLGPDIPRSDEWIMERRKGDVYHLERYNDGLKTIPTPAPPFDPVKFKREAAFFFERFFDFQIAGLRGEHEKNNHDKQVHRISEDDVAKLLALRDATLAVVTQAKVSRAEAAMETRLHLVK